MVKLVEPARELFWQLGLAQRAQRGDDLGEGGRGRVVVEVLGPLVIMSIEFAVPLSLTLPRKGGGLGRGVAPQRLFTIDPSLWPHQRPRLGEISDRIMLQPKQHP